MNFVSSFEICGDARTAASSYPARNCEYGLLTECLWFFAAKSHHTHRTKRANRTQHSPIFARCSTPPPYFLKYSAAAAPNMRGIGGPRFASGEARSAARRSGIIGLGRSGNLDLVPSAPGAIRSNPRARAQRASPARTSVAACTSAALPVEQLLFTFVIGMPVRPSW
jgi:hypothetical protein